MFQGTTKSDNADGKQTADSGESGEETKIGDADWANVQCCTASTTEPSVPEPQI